MDSNQHAMQTNASQPGQQPGLGEKMRHSKALIPTVAVLAVTSLALAAALVSNRIGAQDGVKDGPAPVAAVTQKAPVRPAQVTQPKNVAPVARTQVAQACINCGVVESAVAVQRAGQVNGIANSGVGVGAIAGGLVGGLLGNQVGGGSGKTAATVLGAAGGAYAGHAIEKNTKKLTVYQVRIRMNDGTIRTLEQGSAIAAGTRVVVDGNTVRMAS
jgi:outer membrane lipoprotein SlyB